LLSPSSAGRRTSVRLGFPRKGSGGQSALRSLRDRYSAPSEICVWPPNGAQRRKRDHAPRLMARIALAQPSA